MNKNDNVLALLMMTPDKLEKTFDLIPVNERKARMDSVTEALGEMKEETPDPNDLLAALINAERVKSLTDYPSVYECSYQMPFSKHTFILKMNEQGNIVYSFDKEAWHYWAGSDENYNHFLKGKFKLGGAFYDELAHTFIKRTVTQFHEAALWYFKNLAI